MKTCRILFKTDTGATDVLVLRDGDTCKIGRAPTPNEGNRLKNKLLTINKPDVSSNHAEITQVDGAWVLIDRTSKNGTSLKGNRLEPEQHFKIDSGDHVQIAGHELIVFTELPVVESKRLPLMQESLRSMVQIDVTVMVADIKGEGCRVEDEKDATEDQARLRMDLLIFLNDAIPTSFGHLDRFEKNKIVAWWNVGIPHGAHEMTRETGESRACQTAIKLRDFARGLAATSEAYEKFELEITLGTGKAAGGNYGEVLYDDPTRLMFILAPPEDKALDAPNEIIVDNATHDLVSEDFRFEPISEAYVEGPVQPEALYKLLRMRSRAKPTINPQVDSFR